jgi:hypothetical protein
MYEGHIFHLPSVYILLVTHVRESLCVCLIVNSADDLPVQDKEKFV